MGGGTGMPMAPIGMGIRPSRGGDGTNSGDGWTGSRTGGAGGFSTVAMVWLARGGLSGGRVSGFRLLGRSPRGGAIYYCVFRMGLGCACLGLFFAEASRVLAFPQLFSSAAIIASDAVSTGRVILTSARPATTAAERRRPRSLSKGGSMRRPRKRFFTRFPATIRQREPRPEKTGCRTPTILTLAAVASRGGFLYTHFYLRTCTRASAAPGVGRQPQRQLPRRP